MPPDTQGQSPFAPQDFTLAQPPTPERPEPPPLGILHLMVLTACVAICLAVNRPLAVPYRTESLRPAAGPLGVAAGSLYSIGGGAALAGLLLLTRRRRGLPFPEHPGEYLLVMTGVASTLDMISRAVFLRFFEAPTLWLYNLSSLAILGINCLVFLWAFVCVNTWRWRLFFLAIPAAKGVTVPVAYLLSRWLPPGTAWLWRIENLLPHLLVAAALVVVVLSDLFQRKSYPWTHWFGVGTRLWLEAAAVPAFLWIAFR